MSEAVSLSLTGVKWRLGPSHMDPFAAMDAIYVEERLQRDGTQWWAVVRRGFVLTKDGEWEHEPQPSSRDDEFIARTRWPSLYLATEAAMRAPHV